MSSLKPMKVTVYFPPDMEVREDRARWYLTHAIHGYWRSFALDTDPIRNMINCTVVVEPRSKEASHG